MLGSALSVERIRRSMNREKKKNSKFKSRFERSKSKQGVLGVGNAVKRGIFKEIASRIMMEMVKKKRRIQYMSRAVMNLMP